MLKTIETEVSWAFCCMWLKVCSVGPHLVSKAFKIPFPIVKKRVRKKSPSYKITEDVCTHLQQKSNVQRFDGPKNFLQVTSAERHYLNGDGLVKAFKVGSLYSHTFYVGNLFKNPLFSWNFLFNFKNSRVIFSQDDQKNFMSRYQNLLMLHPSLQKKFFS